MGSGRPNVGKRPDKIVREHAPLPPEPIGSRATASGVVKWWRAAKGYGAIETATTTPWDIWCHFSRIQESGFRELTPGEVVEVDYIRFDQESFKFVAIAVRRIANAT